jgi:MSHA biogenesis protein MshE
MPRPEKVRLGELLVQQQLLTDAQLTTALTEQKKTGRKLGKVLIDHGFLSEEQIAEALARQLRVPYVNLKHLTVKADIAAKLPETQARRFRALVLEDAGSMFKVGMADPTDLQAYDDIVRILRREIEVAVVAESMLLATIDRVYRRTDQITGLAQELEQELAQSAFDLGAMFGVSATAEDAPVVKLLQNVFEDAVQVRASDVHIEPQEHKLHIRFRIDGVLHMQTEADIRVAAALALRLKLTAGLDISEKRLPQDGRFNIKVRNNPVDIRISTMPTQYGESVVMRILNQNQGLQSLDRIGMPADLLARVRSVIHRPSGMLLVTGPTGSGKTTTLYAALAELNSDERKIITVEDPVEYRLPGINQVQVNEKIELTFARVLRSALRQDPDVILVGEMRDHATVETGLKAAMTGHTVLSTLHTNDAVSTPMRLIDMGAPRYLVALSLQMVIAQRLVRVICDGCKEPAEPTAAQHQWLKQGLAQSSAGLTFYRGSGCSICSGTGYVGRTGVYEVLEMTQPVIEAAHQNDPANFVRVATDALQGRTLKHHAMVLAIEGRTTVDEAMRLTGQVEERPAAKPANAESWIGAVKDAA